MMTRDLLVLHMLEKWGEYIEMYPGQEELAIALILASELEKEISEKQYYKGLCHELLSAKHK